jgi:hypothetical protein
MMQRMTVADLYQGVAGGGTTTVIVVLGIPLLVALLSLLLKATGHLRLSQMVANLGIAIGLAAISVEVLGLIYAMDQRGVDPLADVSVFLLLAPLYLVIAAMFCEHIIHPGEQEPVRRRLRGLVFAFIAIVVVYLILGQLRFHMFILTNIFGFIVFVLAIIGILYVVARRFI